ncbi:MAG: hypothetical protein LAQ69_48770 [Acidobacteriia bacterium]|nr:hypothetical protein [Terriglobia bacterium]
MSVKKLSLGVLLAVVLSYPVASGKKQRKAWADSGSVTAVLWRSPTDMASRDLFWGSGGRQDQPHGPFTFVKEDLDGTSPKFVVRDRDGVKWKVKLGLEARPETVAARIVWAAGYYTGEDYFVPDLQVQGMPVRLHRGYKLVAPDGSVPNVRLKREWTEEKKIGNWHWRDNLFTGTRELNGLKVMMALINNWDLKDENNAIYQKGSERIYMVSDLGASFGSAGRSWPRDRAKGNLDSYHQSMFLRQVTDGWIDFRVPARPRYVYLVNPKEYIRRVGLERIGRQVPRADARWMGELLAHLSTRQIRDAFRAAGYSPQEVEGFAAVFENRIAILTDL